MAKKTKTAETTKLKSYHFSIGNSTNGQIGLCGRVRAHSEDEAVKIFRAALGEESKIRACTGDVPDGSVEYLEAYFNADKITKKDIDEVSEE